MAVKVRFQHTPNPNAGKFSADRPVVEGRASRSFHNAQQAEGDALARALFALDGVASLFMVEDFVTVTKQDEASWEALAPRVVDVLERELA